MSDAESVVADFTARFAVDADRGTEAESGRVVLSQRRLVLASGDGRITVPLSSIFDVKVGEVPDTVRAFFDDTVTLAFERDGERHVAFVEGDSETIDRFSTVLFKTALNGLDVAVKHPARIGGRVTDAPVRQATLGLDGERLVCRDGDRTPVVVDLDRVVHFERQRRTVAEETRPVLSIRHADSGRQVTTELSVTDAHRLNVLGRYLRLDYTARLTAVREMDLSETETGVLVAIHSGSDGAELPDVLGVDAGQISMILGDLEDAGLIEQTDRGTVLTTTGRLAVSDRIEDVNF